MNLERGFRRLTLTISLAAVTAGLILTVYAVHRTVIHVTGMRAFMACSEDPKLLGEACLSILVNSAIPEPFGRLIDPPPGHAFFWLDWLDSLLSLFFSMTNQSYTLVLVPLIEGIILTTFLGAIPWGLFYLTRWIVRGFSD